MKLQQAKLLGPLGMVITIGAGGSNRMADLSWNPKTVAVGGCVLPCFVSVANLFFFSQNRRMLLTVHWQPLRIITN